MKYTYQVTGMHCRSCEVSLETEISKLPGVTSVVASAKKQKIEVMAEADQSDKIKRIIKQAGYGLESSSKESRWKELGFAFLLVLVIVGVFRYFDLGAFLSPASFASSGLAAIFTIGLTAGFSSCMALIGGLVLGISARHAEKHPQATSLQKFRPHLFFNLGRIVSFFLLGGLLGELGSFVKPSSFFTGFLIVVAAMVMLVLGAQLLGLTSRLGAFALPKFFSRFSAKKDDEYSHRNSLLLGALTFFLPCGFTQAAQIYAISTGSFLRGGLIMLFFALGTTPGLLGVGGLTSVLKKGSLSRILIKATGFIVIFLSLYNLQNGLNLMNVKLPVSLKTSTVTEGQTRGNEAKLSNAVVEDGVQVLRATYTPDETGNQYVISPKDFKVQANKPVRLEVLATEDGVGCMGSITLPGLINDFKVFTKDEKAIFNFLPAMPGSYQITCAMGIPMGTITVVE